MAPYRTVRYMLDTLFNDPRPPTKGPTMTLDLTKPVATRSGKPVRIICTDRKNSSYSVIGLLSLEHSNGADETVEFWNHLGDHSTRDEAWALINAPEKRWVNLYLDTSDGNIEKSVHSSESAAIEYKRPPYYTFLKTIEVELPITITEGNV